MPDCSVRQKNPVLAEGVDSFANRLLKSLAYPIAILGVDTLWGGDVMCASGTGRFIADSWFSNSPLPAAYSDPAAMRVRQSGGVGGKPPDTAAIGAMASTWTSVEKMQKTRGCRRTI